MNRRLIISVTPTHWSLQRIVMIIHVFEFVFITKRTVEFLSLRDPLKYDTYAGPTCTKTCPHPSLRKRRHLVPDQIWQLKHTLKKAVLTKCRYFTFRARNLIPCNELWTRLQNKQVICKKKLSYQSFLWTHES